MRGKNLFFFTLGAGLVAAGLWGLSVGALTSFSAGTPIKASEVNANFSTLRTAIEALEARPALSFGSDLTGSNASTPGFKIRNEAAGSTALRGEVATTGQAVFGQAGSGGVGVEGRSPGGGGVGVRGQNTGLGYGVYGLNTNVGIGVEGAATGNGGAGVSAFAVPTATALLIDGSIGVRGNKPAFVHTAAAANINGSRTTLDNPMTNGDPTAILIVTHLSSGDDPLVGAPIGVSYDSVVGRWRIFRADGGLMPPLARFNVLVVKQL